MAQDDQFDRRGFLRSSAKAWGCGIVGAGAAGAMLTGCTAGAAAPAKHTSSADTSIPNRGMHLVLLGTQGGPIPGKRAACSSALIVDGTIYIIDAGSGLPLRFSERGLDFARVRAMFVTHLHSDHVADYFNFFTLNWTNWDFKKQTVEVHGPGRASANSPESAAHAGLPDAQNTPLVSPELPTPGITDITELSIRANAYDLNERLRSTRRSHGRGLEFTGLSGRPMLKTHDIAAPTPASVDHLAPTIKPLSVYRDDRVEVTATLVDHPPVFPAFAFRFDTSYGSIVFSGDTTPCTNLLHLANGADVLVNEVMDVDAAVEKFHGTPIAETMARQFTTAHTPLRDRSAQHGMPETPGVGTVASKAGVKTLALNHIYPGDGSVSDTTFHRGASDAFTGKVVVGRDLLTLTDVAGR